jgi:hypothetical protein
MVYLHHFSKIKGKKEVTKQEESRFFLLFRLMIEGSGARSGSMPLNPDPDAGGPKVYKALLISFAVL